MIDIENIRALLGLANPGPWRSARTAFISAARSALRACVGEIERLGAEMDKLHGTASRALDDNAQLRAALTEALDVAEDDCDVLCGGEVICGDGPNPCGRCERIAELRRLVQP